MSDPATVGTATDVVEQWRPLSDAEMELAARLIARARAIAYGAMPELAGRIERDEIDVLVVRTVLADMVIRVLRNRDGLRRVQSTTGPFGATREFDPALAVGQLQLTDADRARLQPPAARATRGGLGTIRIRSGLAP